MLSNFKESLGQNWFEVDEHFWVRSSHDVHVLFCQFKRSAFKLNSASTRSVCEEEAKIDMNNVAIMVKQNVAIMTIFDIKQVLEEWITSKTLYKILLSLFKSEVEIPLEEIS